MIGPAAENQVRAAVEKAAEEMIYIGPDHPYYPLLAELVSAIGKAWQQGYERGRRGGNHTNPYLWDSSGGVITTMGDTAAHLAWVLR